MILPNLTTPFSTLCSLFLDSFHSLADDEIMNLCKWVCMCTQYNMILEMRE